MDKRVRKTLIKPKQLEKGDKIAAISPCNGWVGDILWAFENLNF